MAGGSTTALAGVKQRRWHGWLPGLGLPGLVVALLAGCATTGPVPADAGQARTGGPQVPAFVARAVDATTTAVQRIRQSLESQELQRKFHDAAEHGEESVLALLRRAGIGRGAPGAGTGRSITGAGSSATAARGRVAPAAGARGHSDAPAADSPLADGSLRWPLDAGVISSEFGHRWGRQHRGIDIAGAIGEPVRAAAEGEVIYAGSGLSGYGNVVILRHAGETTTLYAHNSALKVRPGQRVRQGEVVALLGNTGRSTGPHLHFEIRRGEVALDPRAVLPPTRLAGGFATPIVALR
ncbi:MAG: M23 family metallopeptidase [Lautropia sp.]